MAKAILIYQAKFIYPDGAIREMIIWKLPRKTSERPHGLKYRLFYGNSAGKCLVRYDNESGKGDHRHIGILSQLYHITLDNKKHLILSLIAGEEQIEREKPDERKRIR